MIYVNRQDSFIELLNTDLDTVMNNYAKFLHDGDFEKYQPMINTPMPDGIRQYLIREQCRLLWIVGRFTEHLEEAWCKNHAIFTVLESKIT